ncbi:uncharacterized protein [Leptinotarsa decemlineata]|uniref:uncharacterized protein n=1 Tax=Leptinotarsa decemlineata TaxID=7539 RepID=UPI003D303E34
MHYIHPISRSLEDLPVLPLQIRITAANILNRARPPKCNISKREIAVLKSLNSDEGIRIISADNGNATVLLNTKEYNSKIEELLDPSNNRKLKRDPTQSRLRNVNKIIESSSLSETVQRTILRTKAVPPRLYGLPKIYKTNMPLTPKVSAPGSPTYHLAKHLASLFQPHVGKTISYVKDSTDFVDKIRDSTLEPTDILVSCDDFYQCPTGRLTGEDDGVSLLVSE